MNNTVQKLTVDPKLIAGLDKPDSHAVYLLQNQRTWHILAVEKEHEDHFVQAIETGDNAALMLPKIHTQYMKVLHAGHGILPETDLQHFTRTGQVLAGLSSPQAVR